MLQSIKNFISYWYFRYLLVTELYMVEKWERVFIHIFFVVVISALSYFNSAVVLNSVNYLSNSSFMKTNMDQIANAHTIFGNSHSNIIGEL